MDEEYMEVPFPLDLKTFDQVLRSGLKYRIEERDWQGQPFITELFFENGRYILLIEKTKHPFPRLELAILALLGGQGKLILGDQGQQGKNN